ncbi:hypothetical protein AAEX28_07025 [Lentisphaerota bacterium WC36G]|nr:hypothetical protein LJT99_09890 [Lentisphaerae bacterium WC36]
MKKFILLLTVAASAIVSPVAKADVAEKLLLYVPHRFMDALDIVSISLGVGLEARAEVRATRFLDYGAGIGPSARLIKEYNRQYGIGFESGYNMNFTNLADESRTRVDSTRSVIDYAESYTGLVWPGMNIYEPQTGARDYWEIGADLALGVGAHVGFHPVEFADFITGLVCYDLKDDDFDSSVFDSAK